jgi:hypothetical protein
MSISRSGHALLVISLLVTGAGCRNEAQAQAMRQAPVAANLPAQSLKLIPMPRQVSAGLTQSLAGGVQINCASPCAAEDSFAIDDLKAWFAAQGGQYSGHAIRIAAGEVDL